MSPLLAAAFPLTVTDWTAFPGVHGRDGEGEGVALGHGVGVLEGRAAPADRDRSARGGGGIHRDRRGGGIRGLDDDAFQIVGPDGVAGGAAADRRRAVVDRDGFELVFFAGRGGDCEGIALLERERARKSPGGERRPVCRDLCDRAARGGLIHGNLYGGNPVGALAAIVRLRVFTGVGRGLLGKDGLGGHRPFTVRV